MDGNNWRTAQAQGQAPAGDATAPAPVPANGAVETGDWRAQLQPESRQRIVNKIMETLKRHLPFSGPEGLHELRKIAVRFEEKIYAAAVSQSDYLRKISLKMLSMETKSPTPMSNSLQSNNTSSAQNPQLPGTHNVMQNQVNGQGQPLSIPMVTNQSQTRQQLVSQNIQNNITSTGLPSSANMVPALPTGSNLAQPSVANVVNQCSGLQNIQASLDSTAQTGNANGADWQEEVYQKIKSMKDMYFMDLTDLHGKISTKLAQCESLPQQPPTDQINKLRNFKSMVERFLHFLQLNKSEVQLQHKERMVSYEKQIHYFLASNRPRKPVQQGQPQHTHTHDNQINPQMQSVNLQGSMATMQHSSLSSVSAVSGSQQNMINTLQHGTGVDLGQGSSLSSLQAVATGSLQQNPVSGPQQINMSSLSSQSGANTLQSNLSTLQPSSNVLQHQHPKQHEQQMLHNQQMRHQMQQQQLLHKQQLMQQQQQIKQSQTPLTAHQLQQLHQISDSNDMKMRQQIGMNGIKSGVLPQHQSIGQRVAAQHPHHKSNISSPQLQQALSPQLSQHPSPQIDQQNILASLTKAGTPLQSASSPFVVPSPSTPLAPSPMPGESEKVSAGIQSLPNAGSIGHQQATGASAPGQSLAIGTPGISASPLLAEFSSLDGAHANVSTVSGKSSVEQPLERLIKVASRMSPEAFSSSVSDISSVVSMIDRIAGSAPGNGSRAAVGEDLVALTRCRLQARNFFTQDGPTGTKKMKRYTTSNVVSSSGSVNDSFRQLIGSETSDLESTATSSAKMPRIEVNHALIEEIKDINRRLIDTVVEISDEGVDPSTRAPAAVGSEGTTIKCSFNAVALSPNLKSQFASALMSPIQPLRLLVPANYPKCSPILLEKFPVEISKEYEDLSIKAKSRFCASLRSLSQPMSLKEMARTWDICARAVISEYAQQSGGGSFSSKYGTWESCLSSG
ncbi:PREDICTED: mediator of RNA polymerase II transcription subunit 15a-like isoform X7 [Ipomoea nil]|uniref:mediator of RNA polymerase II transcription subunit 15a-like isoform X7 n=1 Tax=Ipomoea nil TaxID=35883 RepID=UPI0009013C8C|nr:PREDICTED: mediator of RNA polymerase II transcription subunit 15a-like isoform X7 [Ipomoea nil]